MVHVHIHKSKPVRKARDGGPVKAAGILFVAKSKVLVTLRSPEMNNPGYWDLPGGKMDAVDNGSFRSNAVRECQEELGLDADFALEQDRLVEISRTSDKESEYITFMCRCDKFKPKLSSEHTEYKWVKLHELPEPMHPHLKNLLDNIVLDILP